LQPWRADSVGFNRSSFFGSGFDSNLNVMTKARVFQSGNSQAVRLPKAFRFESNEVEIFRRGDEVVLREKPASLAELLAGLAPWPDDFTLPPELPQQERAFPEL
jgi:antitoxin VapB